MQRKVEKLCQSAVNILKDFKENPGDTNSFISYYLDATLRILDKYVELSTNAIISSEVQQMLIKSENMIDSVTETFENYKQKSTDEDLIDLDAEISVLEKTIKSEGLKR